MRKNSEMYLVGTRVLVLYVNFRRRLVSVLGSVVQFDRKSRKIILVRSGDLTVFWFRIDSPTVIAVEVVERFKTLQC